MSSNVDLPVFYKIANGPTNLFPFPHIYVRDIFPEDYYRQIRRDLLLYDIKVENLPEMARAAASVTARSLALNTNFTL